MSEKALSDVEEDTKSTKDETVVQEYVNPGYTKQGDPRLRLDTGKEHAKLASYIIAVAVAECLAFVWLAPSPGFACGSRTAGPTRPLMKNTYSQR